MLNLTDALAKVKRSCAPTVDPVLSDADITDILTDTAAVTVWTPSTAYNWGDVIVPNPSLGRQFLCVLPGTSDVAAPQWLVAPAWNGPINPLAGSWWGTGVVPFIENVTGTPWFWGLADGTAAWRDYGPFIGEVYDVRRATYEAWMLKAQKCASQEKFQPERGVMFDPTTTYDHCVAQARRYQPVGFL